METQSEWLEWRGNGELSMGGRRPLYREEVKLLNEILPPGWCVCVCVESTGGRQSVCMEISS